MQEKKGFNYVPTHRWNQAKTKVRVGYWRRDRPVSKIRKVDKKPVRLYPIRDANGMILGYKPGSYKQ